MPDVTTVTAAAEWDAALLTLPAPHILQSWAWGETKLQTGWQAMRLLWRSKGQPIAAAALLFRRVVAQLPARLSPAIGYAPKGPLLDWSDLRLADAVLARIEAETWAAGAFFIKIDPDVRDDTPEGAAVKALLARRGWRPSAEQIQFRNTMVSDLAGDAASGVALAEDALLAAMKPKWRYNIRLAERRGVRVDVAPLRELPAFYALYLETARRHGFPARDFQYFEALFAAQAAERDSSEVSLLIATHGGEAVAGAILATSTRGALYLHGASTYERRALMAPYLTHWRAMQYARARGCRTYDLGAVAPGDDPDHSFHGLYRFKTGFGGRLTHDSGSWDFPVDPEVYEAFRNWETTLPQREPLEGPAARGWPGSAYGSSLF